MVLDCWSSFNPERRSKEATHIATACRGMCTCVRTPGIELYGFCCRTSVSAGSHTRTYPSIKTWTVHTGGHDLGGKKSCSIALWRKRKSVDRCRNATQCSNMCLVSRTVPESPADVGSFASLLSVRHSIQCTKNVLCATQSISQRVVTMTRHQLLTKCVLGRQV